MSDLTLEEKMDNATRRAAYKAAEKHFFDLNQPFYPLGFSVVYRNPGHWDIHARSCPGQAAAFESIEGNQTTQKDGDRERAFRIRGEPGNVQVSDERWNPNKDERGWMHFNSILGAMVYIMEELMAEPKP